jgi:soluble lytic murein transglycosylase-like protein
VRNRLILTLVALAVVALATLAPSASATRVSDGQLKAQLRSAKQQLRLARERAQKARADLAAALELQAPTAGGLGATPLPVVTPPDGLGPALAAQLFADGIVSDEEIAALRTRVSHANKLVHRWAVKVRRLAKRVHRRRQIATWARQHDWRPLIEIAGRKYGVSSAGLYRMMMLESGGKATAGSTYKGLFQYSPSTWSSHWNPWRHESIFNGWAQIRATAFALKKGMGASQWPRTYWMAF